MNIKVVFEKVTDRELAYMYIIKKVAEMPLKKDRVKTATDLINYIQKEQDAVQSTKIYDTVCTHCKGGVIDDDTGDCLTCGKLRNDHLMKAQQS